MLRGEQWLDPDLAETWVTITPTMITSRRLSIQTIRWSAL
jgi:hypothetical protein